MLMVGERIVGSVIRDISQRSFFGVNLRDNYAHV